MPWAISGPLAQANAGRSGPLADPRDLEVHPRSEGDLYGSQADSEGSIPFTRST